MAPPSSSIAAPIFHNQQRHEVIVHLIARSQARNLPVRSAMRLIKAKAPIPFSVLTQDELTPSAIRAVSVHWCFGN